MDEVWKYSGDNYKEMETLGKLVDKELQVQQPDGSCGLPFLQAHPS